MTDDAQSLFGNCAKKLLMFFFVDLLAPIALDILVVLVVVVVLVLVGCSCCSCFLIVLLSCCLVVLVVLVVLLFFPPTCVKRFFRDHQYIQIRPNLSTSVFFWMVAARVACSGQFALQSVEPTRN